MKRRTLPICLVLILMLAGCDRREAAWQEAKQKDTIAEYEQFLENFADSPEADQARQRILVLQQEKRWEEARQADTIETYRRYLEEFPDSPQAEPARTRMVELEWQTLRSSNDIGTLQAFAERHRGHPVSDRARERIAELEARAAEAEAREQARLEEERRRQLAEEAARTHRVQLAAFRSDQGAREGASRLEQQLVDTLDEAGLEIQQSGGYYLIRTGPMPEEDARSLCGRLEARGQECLVVQR